MQPGTGQALIGAAVAAQTLGKDDAGLAYWRRALAVGPYRAVARNRIAELLASRQEWPEARDKARAWVRLEPDDWGARRLLIRCLLKTGDRAGAEAELKTFKALRPGWERDSDHWFDVQQREKRFTLRRQPV